MKNDVIPEKIQTTNRAECIFYLEFINQAGYDLIQKSNKSNHIRESKKTFTHITTESVYVLCEIINDSLENIFEAPKERNIFIKIMKEMLNKSYVNEDHVKPLTNNTRIMNFSWLYLRALTMTKFKRDIIENIKYHTESLLYPTSKKDGLDVLTSMINIFQISQESKCNLINSIIELYSYQLANFSNPFKWIEKKNTPEIIWAHGFLVKKINETETSTWNKFLIRESEKIKTHNPYLALTGLFDSWEIDTLRKDLALTKINKAWHQGKFREKTKNQRTTLNTYISNECKKKLLELKIKNNASISEIIEHLINNQYSKEIGI